VERQYGTTKAYKINTSENVQETNGTRFDALTPEFIRIVTWGLQLGNHICILIRLAFMTNDVTLVEVAKIQHLLHRVDQ
jgi:hypothetical protein